MRVAKIAAVPDPTDQSASSAGGRHWRCGPAPTAGGVRIGHGVINGTRTRPTNHNRQPMPPLAFRKGTQSRYARRLSGTAGCQWRMNRRWGGTSWRPGLPRSATASLRIDALTDALWKAGGTNRAPGTRVCQAVVRKAVRVVRGWCENHEPITNIGVQVGHAPPGAPGGWFVVSTDAGRLPAQAGVIWPVKRCTESGACVPRAGEPVRRVPKVARVGVSGAGRAVFDVVCTRRL